MFPSEICHFFYPLLSALLFSILFFQLFIMFSLVFLLLSAIRRLLPRSAVGHKAGSLPPSPLLSSIKNITAWCGLLFTEVQQVFTGMLFLWCPACLFLWERNPFSTAVPSSEQTTIRLGCPKHGTVVPKGLIQGTKTCCCCCCCCCCGCLHIKSPFLPSFISTPSARPDSLS